MLESYLISSGLLKSYKALNLDALKYLAIVVASEEAHQISKVTELLQWLAIAGVKNVCLYDTEGEGAVVKSGNIGSFGAIFCISVTVHLDFLLF